MKGKYLYCLLCAENGLIVGFPDRSRNPWKGLGIRQSRIDHLRDPEWHGFEETREQLLKVYPRYFVRTIAEVERHVRGMSTKLKREMRAEMEERKAMEDLVIRNKCSTG